MRSIPAFSMFSIFLFLGCTGSHTAFSPDGVEAVDARLEDCGDLQEAAEATTTDAAKVRAIVEALRKSERTKDHKCGDSGHLTLRRGSHEAFQIGILAGHDARYYELRVYGGSNGEYDMYRIPREPFLKAIAGIGLAGLSPGAPE